MRSRIDQPGRMQGKRQSQENSPEHHGPTAEAKENQAEQQKGDIVKAIKPDVKAVLRQVRSVALDSGLVISLRPPVQNPANVRPPAAIAGRVRIAIAIGVGMMNPMRDHPGDWSTFERQAAAGNQKILDNFG